MRRTSLTVTDTVVLWSNLEHCCSANHS